MLIRRRYLKKSQLMLYKYFITITSTSGQTVLDPHVLSGGSN
jgi:hypothetical protein